MRAVVMRKVGDIRLEEVAEPRIEEKTDAVIRITSSAICGTDLHFVRGMVAGMKSGTILGHEAVGVVEEVGSGVQRIGVGDRVVVCSTIACGRCERCQAEDYSQCAFANPNGRNAGTTFFGGPRVAGAFDGLQAEKARIPFADTTLVKLPDDIRDDQAILLSDIFPTGWFGAKLADVQPGKTVAVFGCGPVGLFAIFSARQLGAGRLFAVDNIPSRLAAAERAGAEVINFDEVDPVQAIRKATDGNGVDCAIDAVGVDANRPHHGPARRRSRRLRREFRSEQRHAAPKIRPKGDNWHPGDAPTQALHWAVESLRGAGTLGIIGVYPPQVTAFPIGEAMNKNLSVKMGNCPHRRYIPELIELIRSGVVDPSQILSQEQPLVAALDAYRAFDRRAENWMKVHLHPVAGAAAPELPRRGSWRRTGLWLAGAGAAAAAGTWWLARRRLLRQDLAATEKQRASA